MLDAHNLSVDAGISKYTYTPQPDFQVGRRPLTIQNRKAVDAWLQSIIRESQSQGGLRPITAAQTAAAAPGDQIQQAESLQNAAAGAKRKGRVLFVTHK